MANASNLARVYTLLLYACDQWAKHQAWAESGEGSPANSRLHLGVLENGRVRNSWLRLHEQHSQHGRSYGSAALYWAALLNLPQTVSLLCKSTSGQDVSKVGGYHRTALQAAAYYGNEEVVKILIANGADVNCNEGNFDAALQSAAFYRHETIVDMLIANSANVGYEGGR